MGIIRITTEGSFGKMVKQFEARAHGHADATALAIEWLARYLLPRATAQDHQLHKDGCAPDFGFDRPGHDADAKAGQ